MLALRKMRPSESTPSAVLRSGSPQGRGSTSTSTNTSGSTSLAPTTGARLVVVLVSGHLAKVLICAPEASTATNSDHRHRELRCYGHDLPAHVLRAASSHGLGHRDTGDSTTKLLDDAGPIVNGNCSR